MNSDIDRIWIWGLGHAGRVAVRYFDTRAHICGIIDRKDEYINQHYEGYQIYKYDQIESQIRPEDVILFCCPLSLYESLKENLQVSGHKNCMHFYDCDFSDLVYSQTDNVNSECLVSKPCSEADFYNEEFKNIATELGYKDGDIKHRKLWEWIYIIRVLKHYEMIEKDKKGLGFAVGTEPLPSYFAGKGIDVMASDLGVENSVAKAWATTNENALGDIGKLWRPDLCSEEAFKRRVKYREIDMNLIPDDEREYDFCWSSCAIEHVGSLELSKQFMKNMLQTIRSGGVAVHTTEFNLSSNEDTIKAGDAVIFRRRDIEELRDWFASQGHLMVATFGRERTEGNSFIDIPPFNGEYKPYHLSIVANGFVETSYGIVVVKDGLK